MTAKRPPLLEDDDAQRLVQDLASKPEALKLLNQIMRACNQALSKEILSLPWSARHKQMPVAKAIGRWARIVPNEASITLAERFLDLPALVVYEIERSSKGEENALQMYEQWEGPLLCAMMEYSRAEEWEENQGVAYELTGPLMDLMANTDIEPDVPIHLVRPPFPVISLKPAPGRSFQDLGFALLADFPIEEVIVSRLPSVDNPDAEYLGFELLVPATRLDGSPLGGMSLFTEIFIEVGKDEETPIGEKVLNHIQGDDRGESPLNWLEFTTFLLKILLYITVPSARAERRFDRTQKLEAAAAEKNPKRRVRLENEAERAYDRIVIGPTSVLVEDQSSESAGHREMPTHWRRGFFRRQRHGEGRAQIKHVFIAPLLVRADRLAGDGPVPAPKGYVVRN